MVGTSGETRPVKKPLLQHEGTGKSLKKVLNIKSCTSAFTKLYDNIYDIHDCMNGNELKSLLIKFFFF